MKPYVLRSIVCIAVAAAACLSVPGSAAAQDVTPDSTLADASQAPSTTQPLSKPSGQSWSQTQIKSSGFAADLLAPLAGDFKRLGSSQNWLIAGIGGLSAAAAHPFDTKVAGSAWPTTAQPVMAPGELVGSFAVQSGAALATYAAGRMSGSARVARVGAELFRAQMVSQVTAQVLKLSVQRTRPDGTSLSFPSGHSAAMFATATVLKSEFGWKAGLPAYAAASWVAASRIEANRHYLSDVIAGATLGILAGRSVTFGVGGTHFEMGPMAVPGGLGVSFNKIVKH